MFKCQNCGKNSRPHEKPTKVVVETREKEYVNKYYSKKGKEHEKITYGTEIVKEKLLCDKCYRKVSEKNE